jgi:hypothetical protein
MVDQFSLIHKLPRHKGLYRLYRFPAVQALLSTGREKSQAVLNKPCNLVSRETQYKTTVKKETGAGKAPVCGKSAN